MTDPEDSTTSADLARETRVKALRQASADKRAGAVARAEAGIRTLVKNRQEINYRTVARTAGVSIDFLYSHPELRERINTLRAQQNPAPSPHTEQDAAEGSVIHTLTEALRRERRDNRQRAHELEQRLAAAHGEILTLRRTLREHGLESDQD